MELPMRQVVQMGGGARKVARDGERGKSVGAAGKGEGGVSEDAVRKALELKGLLSKGGGWAPARIAAEVCVCMCVCACVLACICGC
jgi:hypothetical protein